MRIVPVPTSSSLLLAVLAAAGLALVATPALAQATSSAVEEITVVGKRGPGGEPQSLSRTVSYRDLDITTEAGKDALKQRISDTARDLCGQLGEPERAAPPPAPSCRDAAERRALAQMRMAVAAAKPRPAGWAAGATETAAAAPAAAAPASATALTLTNGPVPDTPENRKKYGGPRSHAGKRSAAKGN